MEIIQDKRMKTVDSINFSGKRAVIRVDFNVPLNEKFEVTDETRIKAAIPTLKKILKDGGSIVLMSHLGRPKEGPTDKYSLKHIVKNVSKDLGVDVKFASDCISEEAFKLSSALKAGEVLLLENLRFYKEEEKEFNKKYQNPGHNSFMAGSSGSGPLILKNPMIKAGMFENDEEEI